MVYFHLLYTSRTNPLHYFDGLVEYTGKFDDKYPMLTVAHINQLHDPLLDDIREGDSFIWITGQEVDCEKSHRIFLYEWRNRSAHYFDISYHNSTTPNTVLVPVAPRYVELQQRRAALRRELAQIDAELCSIRREKTDLPREEE